MISPISPETVDILLSAKLTVMIVDPVGYEKTQEPRIWVGESFVPTQTNGVSSIDYNTIVGYDITDFLKKNERLAENQTTFIQHLLKYMDSKTKVTYQLHKDVKYHRYIPN